MLLGPDVSGAAGDSGLSVGDDVEEFEAFQRRDGGLREVVVDKDEIHESVINERRVE